MYPFDFWLYVLRKHQPVNWKQVDTQIKKKTEIVNKNDIAKK